MTLTAEELIPLLDEASDALERGDVDAFMAPAERRRHLHPDYEFRSAVLGEVEGTVFRGHDGLQRWATDLLETADVAYREREYKVLGNDALLFLARFEMKGKGSGALVTRELGVVYEIEDGSLRRGVSYLSHAEAIAAAEEALSLSEAKASRDVNA